MVDQTTSEEMTMTMSGRSIATISPPGWLRAVVLLLAVLTLAGAAYAAAAEPAPPRPKKKSKKNSGSKSSR